MLRDDKGRRLKEGERQRKDTGQYEYRFVDERTGQRHSVYSWRLLPSDKNPSEDRVSKESLRELEEKIERSILEGTLLFNSKVTLNEYFDAINDSRSIRNTTRDTYQIYYDKHVRNSMLGRLPINKIKRLHIMKLYKDLLAGTNGPPLKISSLGVLNGCLMAIFKEAVQNEDLNRNPASGIYSELKRAHSMDAHAYSDDPFDFGNQQKSLSADQQSQFFEHLKTKPQWVKNYFALLLFLAYSGCRIGEASALTWKDINFSKREISIRRNLVSTKNKQNNQYELHLDPPKTSRGYRLIPMNDILYQSFISLKETQQQEHSENQCIVDGVQGFIFSSPRGGMLVRSTVDRAIKSIVESYNRAEEEKAVEESREASLIPEISAHNFRHTFCSLFLEANPTMVKELQVLAGHSSAGFTLTSYTDSLGDRKKDAMMNMGVLFGVMLPENPRTHS